MTSQSDLRSYVERIMRLKEEQDALAEDIRDIYAEAKSTGFDKTAMGQVVTILRKQSKDGAKFAEHSALVETYLAALGSGPVKNNAPAASVERMKAIPDEPTRARARDASNDDGWDIPALLDRRAKASA